MKPLQGKVAIVTGGGTGIGEAICRKFARDGAKVIVNGLPDDPIDDVVSEIVDEGGEQLHLQATSQKKKMRRSASMPQSRTMENSTY